MEDNKTIISCPHCTRQLRIPFDKHIRFTCPGCGRQHEYKNGEPVRRTKKKRIFPVWVLPLMLVALLTWTVADKLSKKPSLIDSISNKTIPESTGYMPIDTSTRSAVVQPVDSTDQWLQELEQELLQEALDQAKDILEKLLDHINEDAEQGNWQRANEQFDRTVEELSRGGSTGTALLNRYQATLAQTKTNILSHHPNPPSLPASDPLSGNEPERPTASDRVTNATGFTLILYYSGPTSTMVSIPPGGTSTVTLPKGMYRIVARIDAPNVREYYGTQVYEGFAYSCRFYISTT